jgi:D-alanine-D-alanine ligase-like ATP-grasp enzyme
MKKGNELLLTRIFKKIAHKIGASVLIEPKWGFVGQITFKNGKRSYYRFNTLDLNPAGSSKISLDKDYSNFFMKALGYPIIPKSKAFFSDQWGKAIGLPGQNIDAAYEYAQRIGFPVIVKPNSGSQGLGVYLVCNKKEFYKAVSFVFKHDQIVLVQKPVHGHDYRLVVMDKKVILAYKRTPLNVVGDGKSTIKELFIMKQKDFISCGRDIKIGVNDSRIKIKLFHQGLSPHSVPAKGSKVYLLDNANLSTGGDSIDVTKKIHPKFAELAIKLAHDMGLRLCGVDLIVQGDIMQKPNIFWVLEINSSPSLYHHFKISKIQGKIIEDFYLKVLKSMEK